MIFLKIPFEPSECSCDDCKVMCKRPCWGTPGDIQKIIDAGHGDKLMLDWWVRSPPFIYILAPAFGGFESRDAPEDIMWTTHPPCTFLDKDGLCMLHDSKLKPIEGKIAHHANPSDEKAETFHEDVAFTWDTEEGRKLVESWKEKYNSG